VNGAASKSSILIAFAGLPATGKTTLARALAEARRAVYLRIDTIEQTLRSSGTMAGDVGPAGYMVAYALAEANLRLGHVVVADSVNPLLITRQAWRDVAAAAGASIVEIEIVCSDREEHRRRVETRSIDVAGLAAPSWEQVLKRDYALWDRPHLVADTAHRSPEDALAELQRRLEEQIHQ
jgi:predicted kinase